MRVWLITVLIFYMLTIITFPYKKRKTKFAWDAVSLACFITGTIIFVDGGIALLMAAAIT